MFWLPFWENHTPARGQAISGPLAFFQELPMPDVTLGEQRHECQLCPCKSTQGHGDRGSRSEKGTRRAESMRKTSPGPSVSSPELTRKQ